MSSEWPKKITNTNLGFIDRVGPQGAGVILSITNRFNVIAHCLLDLDAARQLYAVLGDAIAQIEQQQQAAQ